MDCDAMCLLLGPASSLLNFMGFLLFSALALCATSGSGGGGHPQTFSWPGAARFALTCGVVNP